MDHRNTRHPNEARDFFTYFIMNLRQHRWLKNALFVFSPERSCGLGLTYYAEDLKSIDEYSYTIYEPGQTRPGYATTNERKNEFARDVNEVLSTHCLFLLKDFIISERGLPEAEHERKRADMVRELASQMRHACIKPLNESLGSHSKFGWSAKHDEDGKRVNTVNDDLLLAVAIAIHGLRKWLRREFRDQKSVEMYRVYDNM
jgi:hypothetical protein